MVSTYRFVTADESIGGIVMARWRIALLKWGGIVICVIVAIDLILIYRNVFVELGVEPAGPVWLYWVLLFVGVAATILGIVRNRRIAVKPSLQHAKLGTSIGGPQS